VLINRAYLYELDPKIQQLILLAKHAGAARFACKWGLARLLEFCDPYLRLAREPSEALMIKGQLNEGALPKVGRVPTKSARALWRHKLPGPGPRLCLLHLGPFPVVPIMPQWIARRDLRGLGASRPDLRRNAPITKPHFFRIVYT